MEKINFKNYKNSPEYLQGQKDFREKKIKNEGVKYGWYRKTVMAQEWAANNYDKMGYTILNVVKNNNATKEIEFAFLAVVPPDGCLEITDVNELIKIQNHREVAHMYPQPMEVKK